MTWGKIFNDLFAVAPSSLKNGQTSEELRGPAGTVKELKKYAPTGNVRSQEALTAPRGQKKEEGTDNGII